MTKFVTLQCNNVEISNDSENPTKFYLVVAPMLFDEGVTLTLNGSNFTQTKVKKSAIPFNQGEGIPMAKFAYNNDTIPYKNGIFFSKLGYLFRSLFQ